MQYIATYRAVFEAEDDAVAMLIAHQIRDNASVDLEEDDGDSFDLTQLTSNLLEITPQEVITVLLRARNQLIRVRVKWSVDLARRVDEAAWVLLHRAETEPDYVKPYPVGRFIEVCEAIIRRGENPLD